MAVSGVFWWPWGWAGVRAGLTFGGLAIVIQVGAVLLVRPVWNAPFEHLARRWLAGMALRLVGVGAIVVAAVQLPEVFPPLPTALAYLGVLIPLLFTETRFLS